MVGTVPSVDDVWRWLHDVPDPEIPVVSVVDLGIVRDVRYHGARLVVSITPTYSGCPATSVIEMDVENALLAKGLDVDVKRQLSPPWTTDWITDAAKEKLDAYGIAPPRSAGGPAHCPRCRSAKVERVSQFGSTPCKAAWRCQSCLEPFDYFKCI